MHNDVKINGSLTLEKIEYKRVLSRTVTKNNDTSGKISLPTELIGKEVYIVIPR